MKKIMTLAAIFAAVAMTFSACNKEQKPDNGGNNTENVCPDCGEDPCVCEEEGGSYVAPITIDGTFTDWNALDASKVAVAYCAEDAVFTAMKTLKVYADEYYLYVYAEFNEDDLSNLGWVPLNLYINADNSENDAVKDWVGQGGQDYMFEGAYYATAEGAAEGAAIPYDPSLYGYTGTEDEPAWAWDDEVFPQETGVGTGAGNLTEYEFALNLKVLAEDWDFVLADTFGLGLTISQNWNIAGILPNANPSELDAKGCARFLEVTINK